jgi:hypothetical protein
MNDNTNGDQRMPEREEIEEHRRKLFNAARIAVEKL